MTRSAPEVLPSVTTAAARAAAQTSSNSATRRIVLSLLLCRCFSSSFATTSSSPLRAGLLCGCEAKDTGRRAEQRPRAPLIERPRAETPTRLPRNSGNATAAGWVQVQGGQPRAVRVSGVGAGSDGRAGPAAPSRFRSVPRPCGHWSVVTWPVAPPRRLSARRGRRVATRWVGHERAAPLVLGRPGGQRARRGGGHRGQPRRSGVGSGRVGC